MILLRPLLLLAFLTSALQAETPAETARRLFEAKRYPEARVVIEKIAAAEPNNAEAQFYLGVLAEMRGDLDEAVAHLERATALTPANSNYVLELGGAYGQAAQKAGLFSKFGLAKKCQAALEKAVALDPDNLDARNGLLSYYRQAPSIIGGGIAKAYEQAAEIRKRDPLMGANVLGQIYLDDKKPDEAFALYEATLRTAPDDYGLLYAIGRAAAQTGQHLDRGEQTLRRCLTLTPPARQPGPAAVNWRLGNIAEKRGDPAAARAAYHVALQLDPTFKLAADSLAKLK